VQKDLKEAARWKEKGKTSLLELASHSHFEQFILGRFYLDGELFEQDYRQSAFYLSKAMEGGSGFTIGNAAFLLAGQYIEGQWVPRDWTRARSLLQVARDRGVKEAGPMLAQEPFASLPKRSELTPFMTLVLSISYTLAEQGDSNGMLKLGEFFSSDELGGRDDQMARTWLELAIKNGNDQAKDMLKELDARTKGE